MDSNTDAYDGIELSQLDREHMYDTLPREINSVSQGSQTVTLGDSNNGSKNVPLKVIVYVQIAINILLLSGLIIGFSVITTMKVDGSWSQWSPWSPCGNGLNTRFRTCTNPPPAGGGRQCTEHWQETKDCQPDFSSDGGWSDWSSWGTCTEICGGGLRFKNRSCTNTKPSLSGKQCEGDTFQVEPCNIHICHVDMTWSEWSPWSPCDVTCGNGSQTRLRTCSNSVPASDDQNCTGIDSDTKDCHLTPCTEHDTKVAFTAYGKTFSDVIINIGNGYDNSTGIFTSPVPGIYHFAVQVSKAKNVFAFGVTCSFVVNNFTELSASEQPFLNDVNNRNGFSLSLTGTFHLMRNDTASVHCSNVATLSGARLCSFTGFLVTPDY